MKKIALALILICICFFPALAVQIAAGYGYSLVLKSDGTVWAWGYNADGQLGDGTKDSRITPAQISGLSDVISISAGTVHSLALGRDGKVWAWGGNVFGQLGNGTTESPYWPTPVLPGLVIWLSEVIAVDAGLIHSLFLKSDGTVWACGSNRKGQLGIGYNAGDSDSWSDNVAVPAPVVNLSNVIAIAAGGEHSLALKRDGTVWAWGNNLSGQLGDGNGGDTNWPNAGGNYSTVPVQTINLSNVIDIAAGGYHSLALMSDGTVWAWGANEDGQLGDGNSGYTNIIITNMITTGQRPISGSIEIPWPVQNLTPVQSLVSGVISIEGGGYYSLALTTYGTVWFYGEMWLNYEDDYRSTIPSVVGGISSVKAMGIGSSSHHALVIKHDGTIWAWGANQYGQLGNGTYGDQQYQLSPVQVQGLSLPASAVPTSVLAADFDDDGKDDPMAVDSSGNWFFWHSSQSFSREGPMGLGMSGSPAAGDVDGDGRGDMAVVDSSGTWYFWLSSRGYASPEIQYLQPTASSPQPLLADFDGDSKADPTIVDSTGTWTVWLSGRSYESASGAFAVSGATPVAGDFDGDTKADPVMVAANGDWYVWSSSAFYTRSGPFNFGVSGKPVAGDFDGDRKADPCIVDSSGNWNLFLSTAFYTRSGPWYLVLP